MSIAKRTVHSVQFLRFVAATLVVSFHAHLSLSESLGGARSAAELYLFRFGAVGVHIFFVISGYIMYLTSMDRGEAFSPVRFLQRRLIRIYPVYWAFALLYIGVHAAIGSPYRLAPDGYVLTLSLWPGHASNVIGPAWTLAFEMYFYLAFAAWMTLGARKGLVGITVFFAASIAIGKLAGVEHPVVTLMTDTLLAEFVAGLWVARITADSAWSRRTGWGAVLGALALFAGGLAIGYERAPSALVWGLPSALLVAGCVILERTGGLPGTRRLSMLGDSSYSLYLCHILLIDVILMLLHQFALRPPIMVVVLASTLASIAGAHAFYLLVERRLVARLNKITFGRSRRLGTAVAAT